MMFAATNKGSIKALKYPFSSETGEFFEHHAHSAAVTKMRMSYDDQFLFTCSEDGTIYTFRVQDKDMKRDRDVSYAEEVLITKTDLEEKNSLMIELKGRNDELKMEHDYQMRLKEMSHAEKVKEITEKSIQEQEALKITNSIIKQDKEKEETRHSEELAEERERHQKDLQDLENTYNQKIMAEYEKYQTQQAKMAELQERWQTQMRDMETSREQALAELTDFYEVKLKDKRTELDQLHEDMKQQFREFEETKREIEEDVDQEMTEVKLKFERKLKDEHEFSLRLKGENGIMKKKFSSLQKEIEELKLEVNKKYSDEKKLHTAMKQYDKDIQGYKKEVSATARKLTSFRLKREMKQYKTRRNGFMI